MMRKIALIVVVALLTSNCAAMFHGTRETIYVRSEEDNTRFFFNEQEIGRGTSAVTSVPKKQLSRSILRATKSGCHEKTKPIETELDLTTFLGLLIDYGIVSIFIVDWMGTGAIHQAAQSNYILTPECTETIPGK